MAEDLVAELTLRIINQMNGGIDEVRAEFQGLQDQAQGLGTEMETMAAVMTELHGPEQLMADMQALEEQALGVGSAFTDMTADMGAMPAEIEAAITQANLFGTAIDEDTAKINAMVDEMGRVPDLAGAAGGGGFGYGGGGGRPPDEPDYPAHPDDSGDGHGMGASDYFMELLALGMGVEEAKQYAEFQNTGTHIAITDKLSGADADAERERLAGTMQDLALKTGTSSSDLMDAYLFLVTTGMKHTLIDQMMPALATTSTAYNVPIPDMAQAVFALNENLKVPGDQMQEALATLAYASKVGHFNMADFSALLPEVSGQMEVMGMKGLPSVVQGASALEIIRRFEPTSGQAENDLKELIMYMHSPMGTRMFDMTTRMEDSLGPAGRRILDEYHVKPLDMPAYLNEERHKGVDPINAVSDYFKTILDHVSSPTDQANLVGDFFHNHQAQQAILALVLNNADFKQDQKMLTGVNEKVVATDFDTAIHTATGDLNTFGENLRQIGRDLGAVFDTDVIRPLNAVMTPINSGFKIFSPETADYKAPTFMGVREQGFHETPPRPIDLHLTIHQDGRVTPTPGRTAPGVNLRVNQGNVLAQP